MDEVTQVLEAAGRGDPGAPARLLPLVYDALRRLAAARLAREVPGHTLDATALVHEAYLRVAGPDQKFENRRHFFGAAAEAMRRILVDAARRKATEKHGGGLNRHAAADLPIAAPHVSDDIQELSEVLGLFAASEPRMAELVKLRYFAGMTIDDAAEVLGISAATAGRWWEFSRAWLFGRMAKNRGDS
jgi:RNA polymerase sigma factor (TIGR02999 family)